jgi:hypothetical protein
MIDTMPRTREEILRERRQLRVHYGLLFDSVAALLFRHDPIGIAFDNENVDEYEPEAGTILPRLRSCESSADALSAIHEEFVRWFDIETAGPVERYTAIASEIWKLWQTHRLTLRLPAPDGMSQG